MSIKNITVIQYGCERCGHSWTPRRRRKPKVCPKCKNLKWNDPRIARTRHQG